MRHLIEQLDIIVYDGSMPWLREIDEDLLHHVMELLCCETYEELLDFDPSLLVEEAYAALDITEGLLKKIKGFAKAKLAKQRQNAAMEKGAAGAITKAVFKLRDRKRRKSIAKKVAALEPGIPKGGGTRQMPDKPGKATTRAERPPKRAASKTGSEKPTSFMSNDEAPTKVQAKTVSQEAPTRAVSIKALRQKARARGIKVTPVKKKAS